MSLYQKLRIPFAILISSLSIFLLTLFFPFFVNVYIIILVYTLIGPPLLVNIHHKNTYFAMLPIPYLGLWLISGLFFTSISTPPFLFICLTSILPSLLVTCMHIFSRKRNMLLNRVPMSSFARAWFVIISIILFTLGISTLGPEPIKLDTFSKSILYALLSIAYCSFTLTYVNSAYRYRLICTRLNTSKVESKMTELFEKLLEKFPQKKDDVNQLKEYFSEAIRLFEEGSYEMAFLKTYIIIGDTTVTNPKEYISDKREGKPSSFSEIRTILVHSRRKDTVISPKQIAETRTKLPEYTLEIIQRAATFIEKLVSNKTMDNMKQK